MFKDDIPAGLVKYKESPIFDENTIPDGLKRFHTTKVGVWAKAVVKEGALDYVLEAHPDEHLMVEAGRFAVIEPTVSHHVRVTGPVVMQIEFYRSPADQ